MDLKKESPEKLNVFRGFLAHLPGFEPGTFRLGVRISTMINKPRRCLEKSKKPSNLGIFWLCSLRIFDFFK
jgi:hypothetical protein